MIDLRAVALITLTIKEPDEKCSTTRNFRLLDANLDTQIEYSEPESLPGSLAKPELVHPSRVKSRSVHTLEGKAALIHSLAHIEINAVNLALDIVWRFFGMPRAFYLDWFKVAQEEALHFQLLAEHLQSLGFGYGDLPAHDGLWLMAEKTKGDIVARLGLVPRTLEARGLDASPMVRNKLLSVGDKRGAEIIDIILRDEIGHVALGNQWFRWVCEQRGIDPIAIYPELSEKFQAPLLRQPFNLDARRLAGFEEIELLMLAEMAQTQKQIKY